MTNWISIRNKFPAKEGIYKVKDCRNGGGEGTAVYNGYSWQKVDIKVGHLMIVEHIVTHWAPIELDKERDYVKEALDWAQSEGISLPEAASAFGCVFGFLAKGELKLSKEEFLDICSISWDEWGGGTAPQSLFCRVMGGW